MTEIDTAGLLAQARKGDQQALMQLLFRFHQPLMVYIESNLGKNLANVVSPDDVLQETFISAMRGIDKQRQDDADSFQAWLRAIASNRIRDAARAESSKKRGGDRVRVQPKSDPFRSHAGNLLDELGADNTTASRIAASCEAIDAMQVAMSFLPEGQREALRLHYFERLSLEETADAMGKTTGSVRGLIQRAKEQLRFQLDSASKWLSSD